MLVNGVLSDTISASDRGLLYGDGVFRTMLATNGVIRHWSLHFLKLQRDCAALQLSCPSADTLQVEIEQALGTLREAVVRVTITRGSGARGYAMPAAIPPSRIVSVSQLPEYPSIHLESGGRLHLCRLRLSSQPRLAGIKHLNRLENVLAASEWDDRTIAEGVLLDQNGNVVCGTRSNLFMRRGDVLATPDLSHCGVSGVMREWVLSRVADLGLRAEVRDIRLDELAQADEVFLTNSVLGVWSVRELIDVAGWSDLSLGARLRTMLETQA